VAAGEAANPFEFADIVTTTTHKSLRGPRAGMIFFRRGEKPAKADGTPGGAYDFENAVNNAVFPTLQGGPHNHQIGALAVALKQVVDPSFKLYAAAVRRNAAALGAALTANGYRMVTAGTDNHLVLWDLRPLGLTGSKMEKVCDLAHITLNKNSVFGDSSAVSPGGVRVGTPAMTSRGLTEADFVSVAAFLDRAAKLCLAVQETHGKPLKEFVKGLDGHEGIAALRLEVEAFARKFPMPGFDVASIAV
jgi:glycine hydroxymethyltransferase